MLITWLESMFLHFYFTCIPGLIAYMISRVVSPGPALPLLFILCYIVYLPHLMLIIADNRPGPLPFTRAIVYSVHLMGFIMSQKIWPLSCLHISTSIDAIYVILFWFPQILMWVFHFYSPLFYFIYKSGNAVRANCVSNFPCICTWLARRRSPWRICVRVYGSGYFRPLIICFYLFYRVNMVRADSLGDFLGDFVYCRA